MAPAPPGFNYAAAFGIRSLAAPVVFALFYVPLLALFLDLRIICTLQLCPELEVDSLPAFYT